MTRLETDPAALLYQLEREVQQIGENVAEADYSVSVRHNTIVTFGELQTKITQTVEDMQKGRK